MGVKDIVKSIPVIGTAASVLESIASPILQGVQNRKNRKWNEQMYQRQRNDSLSDWTRQNEYNSPSAQMQRYKEAGLNPNLIYGQTNEAAPVRSTDMKGSDGEAPRLSTGESLSRYYDMKMRDGQLANLDLQQKLMRADLLMKGEQTKYQSLLNDNQATTNARNSLDFHQQEKLNPFALQSAEHAATKADAEAKRSLNTLEIETATKATSIQQATANYIATLRSMAKTDAEIRNLDILSQNLEKQGRLTQSELDLRDQNIHPGDPGYWRVMAKIFAQIKKAAGFK